MREEDHVGRSATGRRANSTSGTGVGDWQSRGFKEDQIGIISLLGRWKRISFMLEPLGFNSRVFESTETGLHTLKLKYEAAAVNLVMASPRGGNPEVVILQDGSPLSGSRRRKIRGFVRRAGPAGMAGQKRATPSSIRRGCTLSLITMTLARTNWNFCARPAWPHSPSPLRAAWTPPPVPGKLLRFPNHETRGLQV